MPINSKKHIFLYFFVESIQLPRQSLNKTKESENRVISIPTNEVIIEKSREGRFLWNRN